MRTAAPRPARTPRGPPPPRRAGVDSAPVSQSEPDDETLMLAYAGGDAAAFDILYRRHRARLYRYLLRQVDSRAVAEELYQDVWLNVVRSRARYRVEAKFLTFLFRVARNRLIDHLRSRGGQARAFDESADAALIEPPAPLEDGPEQRAAGEQDRTRLLAALAALPPAQRDAFLLHHEAGLTVEEVASLSGVNRETAKSRLRYAVARLRASLGEQA